MFPFIAAIYMGWLEKKLNNSGYFFDLKLYDTSSSYSIVTRNDLSLEFIFSIFKEPTTLNRYVTANFNVCIMYKMVSFIFIIRTLFSFSLSEYRYCNELGTRKYRDNLYFKELINIFVNKKILKNLVPSFSTFYNFRSWLKSQSPYKGWRSL